MTDAGAGAGDVGAGGATDAGADAQPSLTLGTAGHIDHGKTVLVRALTGVDTDRLPEERARGISIELGFAPLVLPSGRAVGVVDVPGHERFVRTMVAGASGIDIFLLVVAADDGVMPQTREHLAVLRLLEVPGGVVALTKCDAVDAGRLANAAAQVADLLAEGSYEGIAVVPVSGLTGEGLDDLLEALDRAAAGVAPRPGPVGPARLHVDRSFTLRGIGTVVTGTLWAGELRRSATVRIEPRGTEGRVRALEVHGRPVDRALAGRRVAVNLAGVPRDAVARGDVLTDPGAALGPALVVDASVALLPHARPLPSGARVQLHHGTREAPARVVALEGDRLEAGAPAFAQLRLERPIVAAPGDRFVIRQVAPPETIGGGRVVDPHARRHGPGQRQARRLEAMAAADPLQSLALVLEEAPGGLGGADADQGALDRLVAAGRAIRAGSRRPRWFAPGPHRAAGTRLARALAEIGSERPATRGALADRAGLPEPAAAALLEDMVATGEARGTGGSYLTAADGEGSDPLAGALLELLEADGYSPRSSAALAEVSGAAASEAAEALERMALEGAVLRLKPGLYYHPAVIRRVVAMVTDICEREGSVTIARLRDGTGTSRRYAQALLEHLDAQRVLLREGDRHLLRRRG